MGGGAPATPSRLRRESFGGGSEAGDAVDKLRSVAAAAAATSSADPADASTGPAAKDVDGEKGSARPPGIAAMWRADDVEATERDDAARSTESGGSDGGSLPAEGHGRHEALKRRSWQY